jgi:hypothetical protein
LFSGKIYTIPTTKNNVNLVVKHHHPAKKMKKHFLTAALLVVVMATIVLVAIVQTMPTDDDESPSFDDYMVDSDYVLEMNLDDSEYTEELVNFSFLSIQIVILIQLIYQV